MLVSIITSVYNCEEYVGAMIDSIISQTYDDWELIVIDDASTDNTWNVISSYRDDRIISLRNCENFGLTINLNRAWDIAKGKYLFRIDGDDIAYKGRFKKQLEYMESHPDTAILGGWMNYIGDERGVQEYICIPQMNKALLLFNTVMGHPTMVINKGLLDYHGIRYRNDLRYAQDYYLEYEASQVGSISILRNCVLKYRVHCKQITKELNTEQIKCANETRKRILRDLDIQLTEKDFNSWSEFCRFKIAQDGDQEKLITSICQTIIERNREKALFDQRILEHIIHNRLSEWKKLSLHKAQQVSRDDSTKYKLMFMLQSIWNSSVREGNSIADWLRRESFRNVAIYGLGNMGINLFHEIRNCDDIEIRFLMDRNLSGEYEGIRIIDKEDKLPVVDCMIITVISSYESIKSELDEKISGAIVSLEDIIHEVSLL